MISDTRIRANRQNAIKSTGPRTHVGKTRSAQNARKHGLRSPITSDPALLNSVVTLRSKLIGEGVLRSPSHADALAFAMTDVRRIRAARETCLNDALQALDAGYGIDARCLLYDLQTLDRYEQRAQYRLARAMELASPGEGAPPSRKQALPQTGFATARPPLR